MFDVAVNVLASRGRWRHVFGKIERPQGTILLLTGECCFTGASRLV